MPRKAPVDESSEGNVGGRVRSLPGVLEERTSFGKEEIRNEQKEAARHGSPRDDGLISIEEYNAIKELLSPGKDQAELDARTEVTTLQIITFAKARILAKRFGIKYLDDYVTSIERLSLSKGRKSRLEHVKALSGMQRNENMPGFMDRIFR